MKSISHPYLPPQEDGVSPSPDSGRRMAGATKVIVSTLWVIVVTAVVSFVSYVLVGFTVEVVLLFGFGRWEPLSMIVPHSDLAMVCLSAFIAGVFLARLKGIAIPKIALPIGTACVWGTCAILAGGPWYVGFACAVPIGCVTLLGYLIAKVIADRIATRKAMHAERVGAR